ncbi:MAG: radical SAM protein [Syntrophaceae bacterium]|nr:radical SAM protein [Syntrophaceae bacterium]
MKSFKYLYGPVPSRRLGRSLGIDLVPHKVCTYDCIYCQIGKTTEKTIIRKEYVPVKDLLEEVENFLKEENASIDHLSLAGSGEPTLHSKIRSIIEGLKKITSIPIAVITNGFLLWDLEVREDLLQADIVLPSLDAVSQEVFVKINRPRSGFPIEKVIEGLVAFREIYKGQIWLEILFCKGVNDSKEELMRMKETVNRIRPDFIHLNTVIRPPSEGWVNPLDQKEIDHVRVFFGEKASIISEFDRHPLLAPERDIREEILKILKRRPLSLYDLSRGMGIPQNEVNPYIEPLIREGKIKTRIFGELIYYEISEN